jgi:hypothetical protein
MVVPHVIDELMTCAFAMVHELHIPHLAKRRTIKVRKCKKKGGTLAHTIMERKTRRQMTLTCTQKPMKLMKRDMKMVRLECLVLDPGNDAQCICKTRL